MIKPSFWVSIRWFFGDAVEVDTPCQMSDVVQLMNKNTREFSRHENLNAEVQASQIVILSSSCLRFFCFEKDSIWISLSRSLFNHSWLNDHVYVLGDLKGRSQFLQHNHSGFRTRRRIFHGYISAASFISPGCSQTWLSLEVWGVISQVQHTKRILGSMYDMHSSLHLRMIFYGESR